MANILHEILNESAERNPDKYAVFHKDKRITYQELDYKSRKLANFLITLGLNKNDRVCFYLEKSIEKAISIFGISTAGGMFVPIIRRLKPKQALHIIKDASAIVLITTASRASSVIKKLPRESSLTFIITIDKFHQKNSIQNISIYNWDDIMECDLPIPVSVNLSESDPAAILYTSGSSGMPKGVVLSHLNLISGTDKVSQYLEIRETDRILSILTFGFDYGLNQLTTSISNCAQIVLIDYLFPFDILKAVEKYKITGLAAVSTTWIELLQTSWDNYCLKSLRYITNSGGKIPVKYVTEFRKRLPHVKVYLMYGLTEAFRSTYLDPSLIDEHPDSIGRAVPGEEILVLDENDQLVSAGEIGELVHRGALVSQGYWNDNDLTSIRFRRNPLQRKEITIPEMVVYSGDYVRIDEKGLLYFIGRNDEMIKSAGNRISPTEVENIIHTSGLISEVAAFGVPHEIYGQAVAVALSPAPNIHLSEHRFVSFCRKAMPSYMVPSYIEIWDVLPINSNGKLDRSAIKTHVYQKIGIDAKRLL